MEFTNRICSSSGIPAIFAKVHVIQSIFTTCHPPLSVEAVAEADGVPVGEAGTVAVALCAGADEAAPAGLVESC